MNDNLELSVLDRPGSFYPARDIMGDDMIGLGALWTMKEHWLPHLVKRLGEIQAPPIPFTETQLLAAKKIGHWLILYPGFSIVEMQPRQEKNNRFRFYQDKRIPNPPFATTTSPPQWILMRKGIVPNSGLPEEFRNVANKFKLLESDEIAPPARAMVFAAYAVMSWTAKLATIDKNPELEIWLFLDNYTLSGDTTQHVFSGQLQSVPVTVCSAKKQGIFPDVYIGCTGNAGPIFDGVASMIRSPTI